MAYIANTAFEARITNKRYDELANITGLFQTSSANDICSAGFLCTRGAQMGNAGYTNISNENSYIMGACASTAQITDPIYACNPYITNLVTDPVTGAVYAVGANTLGIATPSGMPGTFTKINWEGDRRYRFGVGNINGTVGTNTFFTIAAGLLVPASTAPTTNGTPYFTLIATGTFTEGTQASYAYYDLEAHYVLATA